MPRLARLVLILSLFPRAALGASHSEQIDALHTRSWEAIKRLEAQK